VSSVETYVPIDVLAEKLSVKTNTVRTWVRQGFIPRDTYIKVANTYRFNVPKVLESLTQDEPPEARIDAAVATVGTVTIGVTNKNPVSLEEELGLDLDENEDF